MGQLALTNIINVSASAAQAGAGNYNTSNLGLFSDEVPAMSFGSTGFKAYVDPTDVATDFGSGSKTYAMALQVFSQQSNILQGGGQLIVILLTVATQNLAFSAVAASGTFVFNYGGHASAAINWNDTAAQIQTKIRAMAGLSEVLVTGSVASQSLHVQFAGVYGVLSLATITSNSVEDGGASPITITVTTATAGETWGAAITRTVGLVQYFGVMVNQTVAEIGQTDLLAAAAVVQALNKIGFAVSFNAADIAPGGMLDLLTTGGFTKMRGLFYGDTYLTAIGYMASYASLGLSVNFSGSNTTITMNLKDLSGVQPDPSMTQTIYNAAKLAGADIYASMQGVPKIISFGANKFYDQVYNLEWFIGAIQVAGFNYLAETSTKIPQTEDGMDGLKGAYRAVCEQGKTNGYIAPGTWTSATLFGVVANLFANILQRGYYIFSPPVTSQSQTDRAARKAPLVQIAVKEAGAIQESDVIVYVNA